VFEFRLRVLEAGPNSYLGIVEGLPEILVHAVTPDRAEGDLVRALIDRLERMMDREATRLQLDEFPTVRMVRLPLREVEVGVDHRYDRLLDVGPG
jgi:2-methylcitrate dehydratase PrpD